MLELEHGIVKFFDDRDGKKFGFLKVLDEDDQETGEEIFFHFNDGQFVDTIVDEIEFVGRVFPATGTHMWHPNVGEKLAFERAAGKGNREKACPWTYAEGYDNRVSELKAPRYRVVEVTHDGFGPSDDTVICENVTADELSRRYPIRILGGKLNDPLAPSPNQDPRKGLTLHYSFWVWVEGKYPDEPYEGPPILIPYGWRRCEDPRDWSEQARRLMEA